MKLQLTLLAAALFAVGTASAASVDLEVQGNIVPASCTITLGGGGAIDLGQIDLASLNDADNPMAPVSVSVSLACTAAAKIATSVVDDRPNTASTTANGHFGLGQTSGMHNIGYYTVLAQNGMADALPADVIGSSNSTSWTSSGGESVVEHTGVTYTPVGTTAAGPASATNTSWDLQITPTIAPSSTLAITGQEAVDGQMTMTLVYL